MRTTQAVVHSGTWDCGKDVSFIPTIKCCIQTSTGTLNKSLSTHRMSVIEDIGPGLSLPLDQSQESSFAVLVSNHPNSSNCQIPQENIQQLNSEEVPGIQMFPKLRRDEERRDIVSKRSQAVFKNWYIDVIAANIACTVTVTTTTHYQTYDLSNLRRGYLYYSIQSPQVQERKTRYKCYKCDTVNGTKSLG